MEKNTTDWIDWGDFSKVEIRVGTIIEAEFFTEARKPALKVRVDFGEFGVKKSSAQITALYEPSDILGRQVLAVVNFKPKQIANFMSECLILGVIGNEEVILLQPDRNVPNGLRIG
jgi:tRNA-binding protein